MTFHQLYAYLLNTTIKLPVNALAPMSLPVDVVWISI
jgi:hypothetical protein